MNGNNIPELCGGGVKIQFERLAKRKEEKLLKFNPPRITTAIAIIEWDVILGGFRSGSRAGLALIQLKSDYFLRQPVMTAAVAFADEEKTRANVVMRHARRSVRSLGANATITERGT